MHLCRLSLVALISLAVAAAEPPAKDKDKEDTPAPKKDPKAGPALAVGKNLPAPFHPFNVNGSGKDKFHCVVSAQGFDPMVLVFVRDLEFSDALKDLLRRLDNACVKNPRARLGCAVVFLTEELTDPVTMDDLREEMAQKLRDLAEELKLQKVVLCLDSKADVEKFDLERERAAYTVVLYNRLKIVATYSIQRDDLKAAKVDEVLKQAADKFGAVRK
jgi:hypothetical protein